MANILIVEDERSLERIFTLNLARRGHTIAEADSVAAAEDMVRAANPPFDLVLLDINLPDRSGWELLRAWRLRQTLNGRQPLPKVIVVTAVRPAPERMQEFAPDAVLLKPFPIETLLQLIDRVLAATQPNASALNADFSG
jgi:DNA-binding response OmpR family regulator